MPFFRLQHAGGRSQWQLVKYLKFWQSPNSSTSSRVSIPRTISREMHGTRMARFGGFFFLDSADSRTLDFFPTSKKNGRDLPRKPEERFNRFIFCWDWDLIRSVFLGMAGAGGGGWFWFQADVVTPSSSVSGACDFLFRLLLRS